MIKPGLGFPQSSQANPVSEPVTGHLKEIHPSIEELRMMTEEFKKDSLDTYQIQQTLLYLKMLQKSSGTSDAMKKLVENLVQ